MKNLLFLIPLSVIFHSCKKEEKYDPDQHITYTHWYQLRSGSVDTLYSVYLPNAFTPNDDNFNDNFEPKGNFILNSLNVYNKSGHVIFETTGPDRSWDGKANSGSSAIVQTGSYNYLLKVTDVAGTPYEYNASVMLYR